LPSCRRGTRLSARPEKGGPSRDAQDLFAARNLPARPLRPLSAQIANFTGTWVNTNPATARHREAHSHRHHSRPVDPGVGCLSSQSVRLGENRPLTRMAPTCRRVRLKKATAVTALYTTAFSQDAARAQRQPGHAPGRELHAVSPTRVAASRTPARNSSATLHDLTRPGAGWRNPPDVCRLRDRARRDRERRRGREAARDRRLHRALPLLRAGVVATLHVSRKTASATRRDAA